MASEEPHAELAAAILDGTPIDWAAEESGIDAAQRPVFDRLRVLAAVADLHRSLTDPAAASSRAATDLPTAGRWGHLRLLAHIGSGAFGEVYRAWDPRLDREVALKLRPATTGEDAGHETAIIEEGRALARVRHPGVVTLYGAEVIDGQVGLWMELVEGRTLAELVAEGKRWGAREAAALGIALCDAVAAVHDAGLVHRDVTAANVMLQGDGRVVLMDFGTGHIVTDGADVPLAGTPLCLAPELFAGAAPGVASDVYGIGVLLYHLLTGSYPMRAETLAGLRLAHQRGDRRPIQDLRPDLPGRLARTIDRAIDSDPSRRHATARGLAAELASARPKRKVLALAAIVAALLAVLAVGWEVVRRREEPSSSRAGACRARRPARRRGARR